MRFMALENFFYNGVLHEAGPAQPKIFDFPDDEVPSRRWRPLDAKARKALEKLRDDVKARSGNTIRIFNIPEEMQASKAEVVEKVKKAPPVDPEALPAVTIKALTPKGAEKIEKIEKGARPSDSEPE